MNAASPGTVEGPRPREARIGVALGAALALAWCAWALGPGAARAWGGRRVDALSPASGGRQPSTTLIDLNRASEAELQLLPGVGPAIARRIVEDRAANGEFRSLADVDRVKGVGAKTLERWAGRATIGEPGGATKTEADLAPER